jgi:hypothetical protein
MFSKRSLFNHPLLRIAVIGLIGKSFIAQAIPPEPNWWREGNPPVIAPNAALDNRGMANIGQAKWVAKSALAALRVVLPEAADAVEVDLVGTGKPIPSWAAPSTQTEKDSQRAPLLIGQLKAISAPFYEHLHNIAPDWVASELIRNGLPFTGIYPWTDTSIDDENKAPATIGQLKAVFSMDFVADRETGTDADGLPDLWEWAVVHASTSDSWTAIIQINRNNAVAARNATGISASIPGDGDNDGIVDSDDADPADSVVDWKRSSKSAYAVMEISREDYSSYSGDIQPEPGYPSLAIPHPFHASINQDGSFLWNDIVPGAPPLAWEQRSRVWKSGTWSSDLRRPPVIFTPIDLNCVYGYGDGTTRNIALPAKPMWQSETAANSVPHALSGDVAVGTGSYHAYNHEQPHLVIVDYVDDQPVYEVQNNAYVSGSTYATATLWKPSGTSWTTTAIRPMTSSLQQNQCDLPVAADYDQAYFGHATSSPGGSLALLGGSMTIADREWFIWNPPASPSSPYFPGSGNPSWKMPYVDGTDHFDLTSMDDGGYVGGTKHHSWLDRQLQVRKAGSPKPVEENLPDANTYFDRLYALNTVNRGDTARERLIAAGSNLWVKKNGTWASVQRTPTNTPILAIADNGVLLGRHSIWRNGAEISLDELVKDVQVAAPPHTPRYTNVLGFAMNGDGEIVAIADDALHTGSRKKTLVLLVPVAMAVDANRDEVIDLIGNSDATTSDKKFNFWINDDHDVEHPVDDDGLTATIGQEDVFDGVKDCDNNTITCERDLEDFARLHVTLGPLNDAVRSGVYSVGFEWLPDGGTPSIRIFKSEDSDGSMRYLRRPPMSSRQLAQADYRTAIGRIASDGLQKFPATAWDRLTDKHEIAPFLFEGVMEGSGKLQLVIYKGADRVGQGGSIWIDVKPIRQMYQRWNANECTASGIQDTVWPRATPVMDADSPASLGTATADDEKDFILFVHGWNMSQPDKRAFAETAFKRLWQLGYKGKFGAFFWPTFYSARAVESLDPRNFDGSEFRAWDSSRALNVLMTQLDQTYHGRLHVMAHSMGNVVTSEALHRAAKPLVANYIASQAALAADVFKLNPDITATWPTVLTKTLTGHEVALPGVKAVSSPNVYAYYPLDSHVHAYQTVEFPISGKPYMDRIAGAKKFHNYYNPDDWALGLWIVNQSQKPNNPTSFLGRRGGPFRNYYYKKWTPTQWGFWVTPPAGAGPEKQLFIKAGTSDDTYEIFTQIAQARSNPTGRQENVGGPFTNEQNWSSYLDKHPGHSSQFLYTMAMRWDYWELLMRDCNIKHFAWD